MKGRKRHIVVDTLGLILNCVVHPADVQDRDGAKLVLEKLAESPASTTLVRRRQLELCIPPSLQLAVVAGGLWETRSVFQGVWEGAGGRWGRQPSMPRQTAGRGTGGWG